MKKKKKKKNFLMIKSFLLPSIFVTKITCHCFNRTLTPQKCELQMHLVTAMFV